MNSPQWLIGKTVQNTAVERTPMNLELWIQLYGCKDCMVITLELPGELDWFETDGMALEATHGKQVGNVEHLQHIDARGTVHHTYRLHFTDLTCIDIFADVMAAGGMYRVREPLVFAAQDPNEEEWGTEADASILDELEADARARKAEHEAREVGQLDPRILAQYNRHF